MRWNSWEKMMVLTFFSLLTHRHWEIRKKEKKKGKRHVPCIISLYFIFLKNVVVLYTWERTWPNYEKIPTAIKKRFIFAMSKISVIKEGPKIVSPFSFTFLYLKGFIYNDFSSSSLFSFIYLFLYIYGDAFLLVLSTKFLFSKLCMYVV